MGRHFMDYIAVGCRDHRSPEKQNFTDAAWQQAALGNQTEESNMNLPDDVTGLIAASGALGFAAAMLFLIATWAGAAWVHVWAWIDDGEPGSNPVAVLIARLRGWEPYATGPGVWTKPDGRSAHSMDVYFPVLLTAFFLPAVLILGFEFYPFVLTGLALLAVAHVARFARRHKKLFDKHVKDPDAHK